MALFDIFMQDAIFFISADDIFIISGCICIIVEQRLFFIIAVFDIRLHDIIMFMSALEIFIPAIEEWFIVFVVCAWPGLIATAAKATKASMVRTGFILHLNFKSLN
jgi:hypothetical protein